jgi:hypothetical protein
MIKPATNIVKATISGSLFLVIISSNNLLIALDHEHYVKLRYKSYYNILLNILIHTRKFVLFSENGKKRLEYMIRATLDKQTQ